MVSHISSAVMLTQWAEMEYILYVRDQPGGGDGVSAETGVPTTRALDRFSYASAATTGELQMSAYNYIIAVGRESRGKTVVLC